MTKKSKHNDGWMNIFTKSGYRKYDKKANKVYKNLIRLTEVNLDDLYESEGLGAKIIDTYPHYATKEGFTIEGDEENTIIDKYIDLKINKEIKKHLILDRVHGGSLMFFGLNDGGTTEDELNINNLKSIDFIQVYDRWKVEYNDYDLQSDPSKPNFNKPERYRVTPINGTEFMVHNSRVHILDGLLLSDRRRNELNGWGNSIFQRIFNKLSSCNAVYDNVEDITYDFIQTILKLSNLQQLVYNDETDVINERLNIIDMGRSMMHTIAIDKDESYEKSSSSVTGLDKIIQEFYIILSAVGLIPVTLLMGISPAGENATGQADFENFYGWVESYQKDKLQSILELINYFIINCKDYKIKIPEDTTLRIRFYPIKKPDLKELSEINEKKVKALNDLIDRNVLLPQEVLFILNNDEHSGINIDLEKRKELLLEAEKANVKIKENGNE